MNIISRTRSTLRARYFAPPRAKTRRNASPGLSIQGFERLESRQLLTIVQIHGTISTDTSYNDQNVTYEVDGLLKVASGVTVTFGPDVKVKIDDDVEIFVDGTLETGVGCDMDFPKLYAQGSFGVLDVTPGGALNAVGTKFYCDNGPTGAAISIEPGAQFSASDSNFAMGRLLLVNGVTLVADDITNNIFDCALEIPSTALPTLANNRQFQTIALVDSGPTASQTLSLNQIGTDGDFSSLQYILVSYKVPAGATLAIGTNTKVFINDYDNLIVDGTMTTAAGSEVTFGNLNGYTKPVTVSLTIDNGGKLVANGSVFDASRPDSAAGGGTTTTLYVEPGGTILSNGSKFSIGSIRYENQSSPAANDLVDNRFDTALYLPSTAISGLANNQEFQAINIVDDGSNAPRTLDLNPIGTDGNFNKLVYVFPDNYSVAAGSTLAIGASIPVIIQTDESESSTFVDNGTITSAPNSKITLALEPSEGATIEIAAGGVFSAHGTVFDETNPSNGATSSVAIDPGGEFLANSCRVAVDSLSFAPGAIINKGDLINNVFQTSLSLPSSAVGLLDENQSFQDIILSDSVLPSSQSLTFKPIGTRGDYTPLQYRFTNSFTISNGASLTVLPGVKVIVNPGAALLNQGTITLSSSDLSFMNTETAPSSLKIAAGGKLIVSNTTIDSGSASTAANSIIQVNSGGSLLASNSRVLGAGLSLLAGSTGSLVANTLATKLTVDGGSTVAITGNTIAATATVVATGSSNSAINLVDNYWGADPSAQITDHGDNPGLPTVVFDPTQTTPSPTAAATTISSTDVDIFYNVATQNLTLTAQVSASSGVNEGTVTFVIFSMTKIIGDPITVNVVDGIATTSRYRFFGLMPIGTYGIQVTYNGSSHFLSSTDESSKLRVNASSSSNTTSLTGANTPVAIDRDETAAPTSIDAGMTTQDSSLPTVIFDAAKPRRSPTSFR